MSWNGIATAAPVVGFLACIAVSRATPQGSDMVSGIGGLFRGAVAMAAICAIGEGVVLAAIVRGERPARLGIAMAVLNLILLLPGVWVLIRMDWD